MATEFLNAGQLRRRGWTGALIQRFAGMPDHVANNPHYPGGAAMRLYARARIEAIEADRDFIEAKAQAERRQASAQKALQTRCAKAAATAAEIINPPTLPPAPRGELIAAAVNWFNGEETWRAGAGKWCSTKDVDEVLFPIVVDFVFDRLAEYRRRARPIGIPAEQATAAVDQRILAEISREYAWLSQECRRRGSAAELK